MSPRTLPPDRHTPPAVQRLRLRYARRGRLRFSSHRDFQRALERAIRRAGIPIAYSAGFSPHPKISYAGAAPTGTASEAEYVEIAVVEQCEPQAVKRALDAALPDGLDVVDIVTAGSGSLADRLQASLWEIAVPEVSSTELERATTAFLERESVEVERLTKNGRRVFDIRGAVRRLAVTGGNGGHTESCAILQLVVRHETPAVRPDDVLAGLRLVAGLVPPVPPRATRLAQGLWDEESGTVGDPLAPDRDAAVTPA
jgi:radical SAM-linked protein